MALIKTVAEVKAVMPKLSILSDTYRLPNMEMAAQMHIVPIVGDQLYDHLQDVYDAGGVMPEKEAALIKVIQLPLAAFAMLTDMAFMHTLITDSGIRTMTTNNTEAAHRWEYNELKAGIENYVSSGTELLLKFLYKNKADHPQWEQSEAYKELSSFLIKTGTDFGKQYPTFQPLRTYWAMMPVMADVEENYFVRSLGRDLFTWVKQQSEIVITVDGGELDVLKLLKKALVKLVVKHAGAQFPVSFGPYGFTVLAPGGAPETATEGLSPAGHTSLKAKLDDAGKDGQNDLSKCMVYLQGIANGMFGNDWGEDFTTAFESSPLKSDPNKEPITLGNERRRFVRFT